MSSLDSWNDLTTGADEAYWAMKPAEDYVSWLMNHYKKKTEIWAREGEHKRLLRFHREERSNLETMQRELDKKERSLHQSGAPMNVIKSVREEKKGLIGLKEACIRKINFHQDVLIVIRRRMRADSRFSTTTSLEKLRDVSSLPVM